MKKINIAELLKDCPKGMELDCTIFDNVTFERVAHSGIWINYVNDKNHKYDVYLDNEGCLPVSSLNLKTTKCVIFPKGKNTWEGFVPPCQFKNGDIVTSPLGNIAIISNTIDNKLYNTYCGFYEHKNLITNNIKVYAERLATEEEKQKLFDAIKVNGYKWNPETKTLEKLPEFKDGDIIFAQYYDLKYVSIVKQIDRSSNIHVYCLYGFTDSVFATDEILGSLKESLQIRFATEIEKQKLFQAIKNNGYKWNSNNKTLKKLIEPKFKVGDRIQSKNFIEDRTIKICEEDGYWTTVDTWIGISDQDNWELLPNKFDITTLKPFESKVLVRNANGDLWKPAEYGFSHSKGHYVVGGIYWKQCIPYKGNEYLLRKTDDCNEYYKTWE